MILHLQWQANCKAVKGCLLGSDETNGLSLCVDGRMAGREEALSGWMDGCFAGLQPTKVAISLCSSACSLVIGALHLIRKVERVDR